MVRRNQVARSIGTCKVIDINNQTIATIVGVVLRLVKAAHPELGGMYLCLNHLVKQQEQFIIVDTVTTAKRVRKTQTKQEYHRVGNSAMYKAPGLVMTSNNVPIQRLERNIHIGNFIEL